MKLQKQLQLHILEQHSMSPQNTSGGTVQVQVVRLLTFIGRSPNEHTAYLSQDMGLSIAARVVQGLASCGMRLQLLLPA